MSPMLHDNTKINNNNDDNDYDDDDDDDVAVEDTTSATTVPYGKQACKTAKSLILNEKKNNYTKN